MQRHQKENRKMLNTKVKCFLKHILIGTSKTFVPTHLPSDARAAAVKIIPDGDLNFGACTVAARCVKATSNR